MSQIQAETTPLSPARAAIKACLRTIEAASYIGVGKSTLEAMRYDGDGPEFIRVGKAVLYPIISLDRWVADQPHFRSTSESDFKTGAA